MKRTSNLELKSQEVSFSVGTGTTLVQLLENHTKLVLRSITASGSTIPDKPDVILYFTNTRQAQATYWALTNNFQSQLSENRDLLQIDLDDE